MASYLHRTAQPRYPCYLPVLGEFSRSWSYKTCQGKDTKEAPNNVKSQIRNPSSGGRETITAERIQVAGNLKLPKTARDGSSLN